MAKTCGLCGYATNDPADFDEHMRRVHHWDQVHSKPGIVPDKAAIVIVVIMTPLLLIPTVAGGLGTAFGVLSLLVMFALVLRSRGLRVLLSAIGLIVAIYAAVYLFGLVLALVNGG